MMVNEYFEIKLDSLNFSDFVRAIMFQATFHFNLTLCVCSDL